jgi:hypothetical protein
MLDKFIYFFKALYEKRVVLLLIGISFGFRLFALGVTQGVANGCVPYGFLARDFLKGHFTKGLSSAVPPSHPFFVLLFSPVSLHDEITGRVSGTLWADE